MKSISVKLFLALFGLTAVVLLAGLGLARWSMNYGFNDYVNSIQEQRLDVIAEQLVSHYQGNGDEWNSDTQQVFNALINPRSFIPQQENSLASSSTPENDPFWALRNQSLEEDLAQLVYLDQIISPPESNVFPPPMGGLVGGMAMGMGPPVTSLRDTTVDSGLQTSNDAPRQNLYDATEDNRLIVQPPPPPQIVLRVTPTILFDANGNEIATSGNFLSSASAVVRPIRVDNVIVGELRAIAIPEVDSPRVTAFVTQQKLAGMAIIFGSLFLTAIASWFLSRMMLAPVVKIKNGITELARGDYDLSLDVDRKDELGLLMADVNKLGNRLEKNRLSRRNFIADISHELRTPTTILSGEIEALKDGMRELNMQSVDSLGHETNRLKHLIEDLYQLSLSDIGGLKYEFKELDVTTLLTSTINQLKPRIENAGLELRCNLSDSFMILGDEQRLLQLFTNLLSNSVAYTDKPGQISVALVKAASAVDVIFEDSSPSVDLEDMSVIFEPLFRAEQSRNRRKGGAGLGLTICRNIAIAHDASIEASRSSLGGMLFRVRFPIIT